VAANDDLLTPEEIEALMQAARPAPSVSVPATSVPAKPDAADPFEDFDPDSLTTKIPSGGAPPSGDSLPTGATWTGASAEQLLQQAEDHLAAAIAPDLGRYKGPPPELGAPQRFGFPDLSRELTDSPSPAFPITALQDVELDLRIELGRTELLIEEVLQLREGTVVPLDKLAGDPVDILVNGRLIARGEVLVLNDNFCVRVAEILTPDA